jgi:hypothetical protein
VLPENNYLGVGLVEDLQRFPFGQHVAGFVLDRFLQRVGCLDVTQLLGLLRVEPELHLQSARVCVAVRLPCAYGLRIAATGQAVLHGGGAVDVENQDALLLRCPPAGVKACAADTFVRRCDLVGIVGCAVPASQQLPVAQVGWRLAVSAGAHGDQRQASKAGDLLAPVEPPDPWICRCIAVGMVPLPY